MVGKPYGSQQPFSFLDRVLGRDQKTPESTCGTWERPRNVGSLLDCEGSQVNQGRLGFTETAQRSFCAKAVDNEMEDTLVNIKSSFSRGRAV